MVGLTKKRILHHIKENENIHGYKLSQDLSIPLTTVYDHLKTLSENGYIQRNINDSNKKINYKITQKGIYLLLAIE